MELTGIAHQIWDSKYRLKNIVGEPIDYTIDHTFRRVAGALAAVEPEKEWEQIFYDALADFSVLPAGRILAGAGSNRKVTLQNCYVMGTVSDSLKGIHDMLGKTALTMKEGGGTGTDFSTIRPKDALIKDLGVGASGPLSFMDNWNSMCRTIMSAGHRRGAMMGTLRVDHPDIEAFIDAKRDASRFRMFNLSVLVTDAFMDAVHCDVDWPLVFKGETIKVVSARELWAKIMQATYDVADPGVIFIDRVNRANPLGYAEYLGCTNPCGEQPLPPWGACCLGSINLTRMISDPFTPRATLNVVALERATTVLVRMLDNVVDVTHYPLQEQHDEAMSKRRIGVGITGLADAFAMLGVRYGSEQSVKLAGDITYYVHEAAFNASMSIAGVKGSFPLYDRHKYKPLNGREAPDCLRNSHVTSIAPTGTISLLAGNVSSGIEPIFDLSLKRRILQPDNSYQEVRINDYAYEQFRQFARVNKSSNIHPDCEPGNEGNVWVTAADLTPAEHLSILAACRPHVDSSISKTINCPETISFDDFKNIYLNAYNLGVKSCTTYRPNKVTGSILSSDSMSASGGPVVSNVVELTKPLVRPTHLHGTTYRLKPPGLEHALFITINDIDAAGRRHPYEIFINTKNLQFLAWSTALTRMISAIFRRGGDLSFITDELAAVFDPLGGGYWEDKQYVPSIIAGIGKVIQRHLEQLGAAPAPAASGKLCPKCNAGMASNEGCWSCTACSYSACG